MRCRVTHYLLQLIHELRDPRVAIQVPAIPWARAHVDHHLALGCAPRDANCEVLLHRSQGALDARSAVLAAKLKSTCAWREHVQRAVAVICCSALVVYCVA